MILLLCTIAVDIVLKWVRILLNHGNISFAPQIDAIEWWHRGGTAMGSIHPNTFNLVRDGRLPADQLQKTFIPAITINSLFTHLNFEQIVREDPVSCIIRYLKLDLEGMDQLIVNDTLDFFASFTNSLTATHHYPCIIHFEDNNLSGSAQTLIERLEAIGYTMVGLFARDGTVDIENKMAINYECSVADINRGLLFSSQNVKITAVSGAHQGF